MSTAMPDQFAREVIAVVHDYVGNTTRLRINTPLSSGFIHVERVTLAGIHDIPLGPMLADPAVLTAIDGPETYAARARDALKLRPCPEGCDRAIDRGPERDVDGPLGPLCSWGNCDEPAVRARVAFETEGDPYPSWDQVCERHRCEACRTRALAADVLDLVARVLAAELRVTALAALPDAIRGARMERNAAAAFLSEQPDDRPCYLAAHDLRRGAHRVEFAPPDPLADPVLAAALDGPPVDRTGIRGAPPMMEDPDA